MNPLSPSTTTPLCCPLDAKKQPRYCQSHPFNGILPDIIRNVVFLFFQYDPDDVLTNDAENLNASDTRFSREYFKCWRFRNWILVGEYLHRNVIDRTGIASNSNANASSLHHLANIYSLVVSFTCSSVVNTYQRIIYEEKHPHSRSEPRAHHSKTYHQMGFMNRENAKRMARKIIFTDSWFQGFTTLRVLDISNCYATSLTDEMFCGMSHLQELHIESGIQFTDRAIENLYRAGSRLKKLNIAKCMQITDDSMPFLKEIEELDISQCHRISDEGMRHLSSGSIRSLYLFENRLISTKSFHYLRGIQNLTMENMNGIDCREAFRYLEGSIRSLIIVGCQLDSLGAIAFSHLRGISELVLCVPDAPDLSDDAFQHLKGLKRLVLSVESSRTLTAKLFSHLHGIQVLDISSSGIRVDSPQDVQHLKSALGSVTHLKLSTYSFSDELYIEEMRQFVEEKGAEFELF